jgi:tRNA(fMet)-specific endonuclease VapC
VTYLLDTNIVIAILNKEPSIEENLKNKSCFLPSIVLGELYYGARKSTRAKDNLANIEAFITNYLILDCTKQTADYYGIIKQALESKGTLIPENDMWIAAIAKQHSLSLVTRDDHFNRVDGLSIVKW